MYKWNARACDRLVVRETSNEPARKCVLPKRSLPCVSRVCVVSASVDHSTWTRRHLNKRHISVLCPFIVATDTMHLYIYWSKLCLRSNIGQPNNHLRSTKEKEDALAASKQRYTVTNSIVYMHACVLNLFFGQNFEGAKENNNNNN
jgi:hypothetical protein